MERQTRRALLGKVGAGVAVGALASVAKPLSFSEAATPAEADAASKYQTQILANHPWMPAVTFIEDGQQANTWNTVYNIGLQRHEIHIPIGTTAPVSATLVEHESGHVLANYVYNARGPAWSNPGGTGPWDLYVEFLRYMGGDPALRNRMDINEIFAEHFSRAWGYPPTYPGLVGLVPFNAQTEKNFVNQIAPPSSDGYAYISPDLGLVTDASGNWFGTVGISGMYGPAGGQVPILGVAERIGLAGSEASLPDCTFWVPAGANGAWGYLMVRGDPVRGGTAFFRVSAFE